MDKNKIIRIKIEYRDRIFKNKHFMFSIPTLDLLKLEQHKMCIFLNIIEQISIPKGEKPNVLLQAIMKSTLHLNFNEFNNDIITP